MSTLSFNNRVAVVTGAGGGLGRAYALMFASRGAKVVVNDLGTAVNGENGAAASRPADQVVAEIRAAGGQAAANFDSVENGDKIIEFAVATFGRIDILINNAGILRDRSFANLSDADWDRIYAVHLYGAYKASRAAWGHMRNQNYGRILFTSSASGLYGNVGQTNYAAMKLALVGFSNTLAREGASKNILVNAIAPIASTRMTKNILGKAIPEDGPGLSPDFVAPVVAFLSHESCTETGGVFEVGGGWVSKVRWERGKGQIFGQASVEDIKASWSNVHGGGGGYPESAQESFTSIISSISSQPKPKASSPAPSPTNTNANTNANTSSKSNVVSDASSMSSLTNAHITPLTLFSYKFPPSSYTITAEKSALYALSLGLGDDPLCPNDFPYLYELHSNFLTLPTMGVLFPFSLLSSLLSADGLSFNPMMLLHGEQSIEILKPFPTEGTLVSVGKVKEVQDKGKAGVVVLEAETRVKETGEVLARNEMTVFIRGIGGFAQGKTLINPHSKPTTPSSNAPNRAIDEKQVFGRKPDAVVSTKTKGNAALLYRLASGDMNPLHADPAMAAVGGFDRPILHGLCTMGIAGRAVLSKFCGNNPNNFKGMHVRFGSPVYPGETIVTEMWKVDSKTVVCRVKVAERDKVVLLNTYVTIAENVDTVSKGSDSVSGKGKEGGEVERAFAELGAKLKAAGKGPVEAVKGVYVFEVTGKDGKAKSYTVDLKNGESGVVKEGAENADVTLVMAEEDLVAVLAGKANAQQLFMQGKMKIKGNMAFAMKLGQVLNTNKAKM